MLKLLQRFVADDHGATAVEYGIMVALIAVAIIATVGAVGIAVRDNLFQAAVDGLSPE
jgi:pilus assembly protein Flp/PilA